MGNESGEWIMHGMKWDNPDCIHSVDEAIKYINEFGFLPLFKNDIDGFSLEERTIPELGTYSTPHTVQFLGFNAVHRFVGVICNSPTKPMNL
jgi:hypothetical protein